MNHLHLSSLYHPHSHQFPRWSTVLIMRFQHLILAALASSVAIADRFKSDNDLSSTVSEMRSKMTEAHRFESQQARKFESLEDEMDSRSRSKPVTKEELCALRQSKDEILGFAIQKTLNSELAFRGANIIFAAVTILRLEASLASLKSSASGPKGMHFNL